MENKNFTVIDEVTPPNAQLSGHYKRSLGYCSVRYWLPGVLDNQISQLTQSTEKLVQEHGNPVTEEIREVIHAIAELKKELHPDNSHKSFEPIERSKDSRLWNESLAAIEISRRAYYSAPWLFVECYVYRRLKMIFDRTTLLRDYDFFKGQKDRTLVSTLPSIKAIANYLAVSSDLDKHDVLLKILKLNLWGNKIDLCATAGQEFTVKEDPFDRVLQLESCVLADDSEKLWDLLEAGIETVEFINDNAGYELFVDLILGDFLLDQSLAKQVTFNLKGMPWFISDALEHDFHYLLSFLKASDCEVLIRLGAKWQKRLDSNEFVIQTVDDFWTTAFEYSKMKEVAPLLYERLSKADLLIFKGDLNYRKLLSDLNWDPTTPFKTSLKGFQPTNLVSIRTVKSDIVSGLKKGQIQSINGINRHWMAEGGYGVIQFAEI